MTDDDDRIIRARIAVHSVRAIAKALNERGIKTVRGAAWQCRR